MTIHAVICHILFAVFMMTKEFQQISIFFKHCGFSEIITDYLLLFSGISDGCQCLSVI